MRFTIAGKGASRLARSGLDWGCASRNATQSCPGLLRDPRLQEYGNVARHLDGIGEHNPSCESNRENLSFLRVGDDPLGTRSGSSASCAFFVKLTRAR